jgi:hypothetical protein
LRSWKLWWLGCMDKWTHGFKSLILSHLIKSTLNQHFSFICGLYVALMLAWTQDVAYGWAGYTTRSGRTCGCGPTCHVWFDGLWFSPNYVPTSKILNTTHGTLLVPKMCMKHVICSSHYRDNDGRIFVVRTVNNHVSK